MGSLHASCSYASSCLWHSAAQSSCTSLRCAKGQASLSAVCCKPSCTANRQAGTSDIRLDDDSVPPPQPQRLLDSRPEMNWPGIVADVLAQGSRKSTPLSKVLKRSAVAAKEQGAKSKKSKLRSEVQSFLASIRGQAMFKLQDDRVSSHSPHRAHSGKRAATASQRAEPAGAATPSNTNKKRKQRDAEAAPAKTASAEAVQAPRDNAAAVDLLSLASPVPTGRKKAPASGGNQKRSRNCRETGAASTGDAAEAPGADAETGAARPTRRASRKAAPADGAEAPSTGGNTVAQGGTAHPEAQRGLGKAALGAEEAGRPAGAGEGATGVGPKRKRRRMGATAAGSAADELISTWREDQRRRDVKKGRFSKAERETIKQAIMDYANEHSLSKEDLSWLFATRHGEDRTKAAGAWQIVAQQLPDRTAKSVWACGTRMLHQYAYKGRWTPEEDLRLHNLVEQKGAKWKEIGPLLERAPASCRDRWKEVRLGKNQRKGKWDEEETARLRQLVEEYIEHCQANDAAAAGRTPVLSLEDIGVDAGAVQPKKTGRIILDDVDWATVAERHGTRSDTQCRDKWYKQLCPSMVARGLWGSGDDRRMLRSMLHSKVQHEHQLDWGSLVTGRNAQVVRRRWRTMLKEVKDPSDFEFQELLELLVKTHHRSLLKISQQHSTQPKEEKPSLAGAQIKTRKRNIAVPLDPGSFADAVVAIFQDVKDGDDVEKNLIAAVKVLEGAELDFSRYGETLFEVLFAGGRLAAGGNVVVERENKKLEYNVMSAKPDREAILPYIKVCQQLIRRRPFLIKALESTLSKLLKSLDFYDEDARQKVAIATARVFSMKVGVLPDRVLMSLMNDRMVAKGTILEFVTDFFQDYLATDNMDDLVILLRKARLDDRLLEFFPPQKRNLADFEAYFKKEGLSKLVEHNNKKVAERQLDELKVQLTDMISGDPPASMEELLDAVKSKKAEFQLQDTDIIKVVWTACMSPINTVGKNSQQILSLIQKQLKTYHLLLNECTKSGRVEAALINHVQVYCYEDSKLLKLFSNTVRILYDADVLGEDTILFWYKKGSHPKGRNVFLRDIEPFIKWLEEAEEED